MLHQLKYGFILDDVKKTEQTTSFKSVSAGFSCYFSCLHVKTFGSFSSQSVFSSDPVPPPVTVRMQQICVLLTLMFGPRWRYVVGHLMHRLLGFLQVYIQQRFILWSVSEPSVFCLFVKLYCLSVFAFPRAFSFFSVIFFSCLVVR